MDTATILKQHYKQNIPALQSGQVVRVSEKIVEGGRERVQVFEGLVIAVKHGQGLNGTFTVRKMALGRFGVEKVFLLHQPSIQKIEILRQEKVRRAKLYFMRDKVNKKMKKRKTKEVNSAFDLQAYIENEVQDEQVQEAEQVVTEQSEAIAQEQTPKATEQGEQASAEQTQDKPVDKTQEEQDANAKEQESVKQKQDSADPQQETGVQEKEAGQESNQAQEVKQATEEKEEKADKQE